MAQGLLVCTDTEVPMTDCATCPKQEWIEAELEKRDMILNEREKHLNLLFQSEEKARSLAREQIDHRLESMNQFQRRIDRLENTFATKKELETTNRLLYVAFGIVLTLQFLAKFLLK